VNEASQLSAEIGVESPRPVRVRSRSETDRRHRLDGLVLGNCVRACTTRNPSDSRATQVGSLPFRGPARVARDTSSTFVRSLHRRSSGRSIDARPVARVGPRRGDRTRSIAAFRRVPRTPTDRTVFGSSFYTDSVATPRSPRRPLVHAQRSVASHTIAVAPHAIAPRPTCFRDIRAMDPPSIAGRLSCR
jgi:hypothetical protein